MAIHAQTATHEGGARGQARARAGRQRSQGATIVSIESLRGRPRLPLLLERSSAAPPVPRRRSRTGP